MTTTHGIEKYLLNPNPCFPSISQVSPGGGFGPVSDMGYGIAYSVPNENVLQFHVTSKFSCADTSSQRMLGNIFTALADMKAIFDTNGE